MGTVTDSSRFEVLKNVLDAVIVLDMRERVLFWNSAAEKLYKVPADQAVGRSVYKAIGLTSATMSVEQIRAAVLADGCCHGEAEHLQEQGPPLWVDWSISRCELDGGEPGYVVLSRDITDRRMVENALRQSEENYSSLFREMLEGFALHEIILDDSGCPVDYRFLAINPAFERMTGLTASDVVGRTVLDVIPGTESYWIEIYGKVALTGEPAFFQNYADGLGKHFEVTAFRPAHNQFACIFADITERKMAEAANELNESRLRSLISIMQHRAPNQQEFLDYALDEAIKLSSSAIGYIYHYREDTRQFILNTWSDGVMDECTVVEPQTVYDLDNTGFWGEVVRQRRALRLNQFEAPHPLKKGVPEGHVTLKTFMSIPIMNGDQIIAVVGLANKVGGYTDTDELQITLLMDSVFRELDRIHAEGALRESEERYRSITEHSHNAICIVDEQARIIWGNERMCEISGFSLDQLYAAASFANFIAPESVEFVVSNFGKFVAGQEYVHHYTFWFVTATGERRLAEKYMADYRDQAGRPRLIINIMDVTDVRRAEEERARLEEQLQQAMKMEAVGRLAGGVAHDFNNLLTGITGHVSLALMDLKSGDPLADNLVEIRKAAESAAGLTRQLLAFSRKQIIEPRILDLNDIITSMHKMLLRLIGEDIRLSTIPGAHLGAVKVDPGQFEQILVNLVVNGRDAMPEGGELTIKTANVELDLEYCRLHPYVKAGRYVEMTVTDTGHGMSDEVKEHLFEPFFTTKPKGRGTGFGLATIYGAVKQASGSIEVVSQEGHGTTVQIFLPRVDDPAERLREESGLHEVAPASETILFVEDEAIVREVVVRVLDMRGYNVLEAQDPESAIEIARAYTYPIDLLMTDVVMPGMNGRQLADLLIKIHPEMKILFSSGYSESEISHHRIVDEGLNYIAKPFTPDALARKLRDVLRGPGGTSEA